MSFLVWSPFSAYLKCRFWHFGCLLNRLTCFNANEHIYGLQTRFWVEYGYYISNQNTHCKWRRCEVTNPTAGMLTNGVDLLVAKWILTIIVKNYYNIIESYDKNVRHIMAIQHRWSLNCYWFKHIWFKRNIINEQFDDTEHWAPNKHCLLATLSAVAVVFVCFIA